MNDHPSDQTATEHWREQMERSLRAETGWLALAGLFWLVPGVNRVGSDRSNQIVLPDSAPASLGSFTLQDSQVTFTADPGASVTINGEPAATATLRSDREDTPDLVATGSLAMHVIQRGERYGIRLRDANHPARERFAGRRWFAVQDAYRISATFVPYEPPKPVTITNILGDTSDELSPGYVEFTLHGQQCRLEASSAQRGLFFVFRDQTSGIQSYPAARFLVTAPPEHGRVLLDFNRAYSPPCAFTPYATCPLPSPHNHLPVAVEAGELWQPEPDDPH